MSISRTPSAARRNAAPELTEEQFLQQVRELATLCGWASYHTRRSTGSDRGWPDLALVSRRQGRMVFAELKKRTGVVSEQQRDWLGTISESGFEAAVWRPADLEAIKAILRGQSIPTNRAAEAFQ